MFMFYNNYWLNKISYTMKQLNDLDNLPGKWYNYKMKYLKSFKYKEISKIISYNVLHNIKNYITLIYPGNYQ